MLIIKDQKNDINNLKKIKSKINFLFKGKKKYLIILNLSFLAFLPIISVLAYKKLPIIFPNIAYLNKNTIFLAPYKYLISYLKPINRIQIDINTENSKGLSKDRNNAINSGYIFPSMKNFYKAKLKLNQEPSVDISMRLKGDSISHVSGNKWSFRIKTKNNNTVLGLKKFSLQSPERRFFLNEWLFHELLKYEGLPYLRYELAEVFINGSYKGIYSLEEHFDKLTVENSFYREGPILALDEENWWIEYRKGINSYEVIDSYNKDTKKRDIKLFDSKNILKDKNLSEQYQIASSKLSKFKNKQLSVKDFFEKEKLVSYLSIIDLMGASHTLHWNQLRIYFNPITEKFIPIGFDAKPGNYIGYLTYENSIFPDNFIFDMEFIKSYNKFLEKITSEKYWSDFTNSIENKKSNLLSNLYRTYPWYSFKNLPDFVSYNRKVIRNYLYPKYHLKSKIYLEKDYKLILELQTNADSPLDIKDIYIEKVKVNNQKFVLKSRYSEKKYIEIDDKNLVKNILNNIGNKKNILINIKNRTLGTKNYFFSNSSAYFIDKNFNQNKFNIMDIIGSGELNISDFSFIKYDKSNKKIYIPYGIHKIKEPLFIPENKELIISSGAKIIFEDRGMIYSKGNLKFIGTKEKPIYFYGNSKNSIIAVMNAKEESIFSHVIFDNLSSDNLNNLSGAITFYESDIKIDDCLFKNIQSEDTINIFRSKFIIRSSNFQNIRSDGIDIDFGEGSLFSLNLVNIGNDGIDISGSNIYLKDIEIEDVRDKALSVGERSKVKFNNLKISKSSIGLASKDSSLLIGHNLNFNSLDVGFAAYRKKEEFKGAEIIISNYTNNEKNKYTNTKKLYLLEKGSNISVNGKKFNSNSFSVKDLFYGNVYGKKTSR